MFSSSSFARDTGRLGQTGRLVLILLSVATISVGSTLLVYWMGMRVATANAALARNQEILAGLEELLSTLTDAESGERGFLLTGDGKYLEPYEAAVKHVGSQLEALDTWAATQDITAESAAATARLTREILNKLSATIESRQQKGLAAAEARVQSGLSKRIMEDLRVQIGQMKDQERAESIALRQRRDDAIAWQTWVTVGTSGGTVVFLLWTFRRIRQGMAGIERQKQLLAVTLASIGNGVIVTDRQGRVTFVNGEAERLTGWTMPEAVGQRLSDVFKIINEKTREPVESPVAKVLREGAVVGLANHTILIARDGRETAIDDSGAPIRQGPSKVLGVVLVFRDFSTQKRMERERENSIEFLRLVNASTGMRDLIQGAVHFFRKQSGCEAVGIRLREGDDYPYYESHGFAEQFVRTESSLCSRGKGGQVARDSAGNAVLECLCGNVISGRVDLAQPFFSPAGSFWTNGTTELLASTADTDQQAQIRNRCNGEGYESVALIALRVGEQRLGLLQINDRRKNRFTPALIALWERLAGYLAVALAQARAEESLRESEGRFRSLFESMDEGFALCEMVYDETGKAIDFLYLNVNPAFEKITGLSAQQVLGQRVTQAIPGIEPYWIEGYAEVVRTGQSQRFSKELAVLGRQFEVYAYSPGSGRFAAIFLDVTEQKRVQERSHLHMTVLESAANAIVITGRDGVIEWVNPAFTRLTGYTAEEAMGQNPRVLNSGRHERSFFEQMWETITAGEVWHGEVVNRRKNGSVYSEEMTITPVTSAAGQVTHYIAIKQDITDRKEAERRLREAAQRLKSHVENSPVAVVEFDTEMRITRWTEGAERIFGWKADEVLGQGMWDVPWIFQGDQAKVAKITASLLDGSAPRNVSPNRNVRKDGSVIWCEWYNSSLHNEQGELDSIFSVVLDVTARVNALEAVEQARATAETASKAKDHFLAVLSHELRNPLNPVLATATMLRADPRFDADTREHLEVICRNAELEARLIDDLLDVTRIERGKVELDRRPTELGTVIRRAVEVCRPSIEARELRFGVEAADGPYWLDADAARLQQVFWNLLKNAVKFTPVGGSVGIRCYRDGEGFVAAEVHDSGEGIEPEALSRIFNAFEQAERSITRQFGGLGLGLTISRALVELHGGSIYAYSQGRGKGATFSVRLPLSPAKVAVSTTVPTPAGAQDEAPTGVLRILLVEDHGDTSRIMRKLLIAEGHEVQTAADVASALRLADERAFDLILSDLGLPDGSGLDLMRALRAKGINVPGIAISGYGQERDLQESREVGFTSHLIKPVNIARLKEEIARIASARWGDGSDGCGSD